MNASDDNRRLLKSIVEIVENQEVDRAQTAPWLTSFLDGIRPAWTRSGRHTTPQVIALRQSLGREATRLEGLAENMRHAKYLADQITATD